MGVDQFLDQDFGGSEDLNSDSGGEAPSSSDDLSDLDDNGLVQYLPEDAPVQMTVGVSSMGKSPEQAQREVAREASQTKDACCELVTREVRSHKEGSNLRPKTRSSISTSRSPRASCWSSLRRLRERRRQRKLLIRLGGR